MILSVALLNAGCTPLPESGAGLATGTISDQWTVTYDPLLGTPSSMTNRVLQENLESAGKAVKDSIAEAAVRAVIHENRDWFRLRPEVDDFGVVKSLRRGYLRLLTIEQRYRGVPVAGARYEARVLPSGRVGSLTGRFYPEINIATNPVLTSGQAEERALTQPPGAPRTDRYLFENNDIRFQEQRQLVIVPQGSNFVLAWGVVVRTPPEGFSRVYVDATSGNILGQQYLGVTWQR